MIISNKGLFLADFCYNGKGLRIKEHIFWRIAVSKKKNSNKKENKVEKKISSVIEETSKNSEPAEEMKTAAEEAVYDVESAVDEASSDGDV